jgi:hypothetical protein
VELQRGLIRLVDRNALLKLTCNCYHRRQNVQV